MPWTNMDLPEEDVTQAGLESIGRMVLRLRRRAGWTQRQLQLRSGVDQAVISRIENGKQHGLSWWRFGRLIGVLGGIEPPEPPPPLPWRGPSSHPTGPLMPPTVIRDRDDRA